MEVTCAMSSKRWRLFTTIQISIPFGFVFFTIHGVKNCWFSLRLHGKKKSLHLSHSSLLPITTTLSFPSSILFFLCSLDSQGPQHSLPRAPKLASARLSQGTPQKPIFLLCKCKVVVFLKWMLMLVNRSIRCVCCETNWSFVKRN